MDITPYIESLRQDLVAAAEAGGPEAQASAERLAVALAPAARLAIMEAVSQAAAEITAEMPAGGVDVRLDGRDLAFVVDSGTAHPSERPGAPEIEDDADENVARVTLRLPESVKARAEELAGQAGQSLNTWLVQAVRAATQQSAARTDLDLSSIPFDPTGPFGRGRGSRRMTGWL